MIAYGTKIISDIDFPQDFSHVTALRQEVALIAKVPDKLKNAISYGFSLFFAHGRNVYAYSDREFNGSEAGQP